MFLLPLFQIEEVEALSSIYGDEWCVIDEASRIFCIKISNDSEESKLTACLQVNKKRKPCILITNKCFVVVVQFMIFLIY